MLPLHQLLTTCNRPYLCSPLAAHHTAPEYTLGWRRQSFTNWMLDKHQFGVALVVGHLYYLRWLRNRKDNKTEAVPRIDLSFWLQVLMPKQWKQGQYGGMYNGRRSPVAATNTQAVSSSSLTGIINTMGWLPNIVQVASFTHHHTRTEKMPFLQRMSMRHKAQLLPLIRFLSLGSTHLPSLRTIISTPSYWLRSAERGSARLGSATYREKGQFARTNQHHIFTPAIINGSSDGDEHYSSGANAVQAQPDNDKNLPTPEHSQPSPRGDRSRVQLRLRRIPTRNMLAADIRTDQKVGKEQNTDRPKAHHPFGQREAVRAFSTWQRTSGDRHHAGAFFKSAKKPLVSSTSTRVDEYGHAIRAFHSTSDPGVDDNVDGPHLNYHSQSAILALRPRMTKQQLKARLTWQDHYRHENIGSMFGQSTGLRHVSRVYPEIPSRHANADLHAPEMKYARRGSQSVHTPQKATEEVHEHGTSEVADISRPGRITSATEIRSAEINLLADRVYSLIVDRVKIELRMRGR